MFLLLILLYYDLASKLFNNIVKTFNAGVFEVDLISFILKIFISLISVDPAADDEDKSDGDGDPDFTPSGAVAKQSAKKMKRATKKKSMCYF